ncbi:hypothetical protein M3Y99_01489100 [Aphelenchoides fujianensis]|nr:hypothetical protein M3Y99_01489100 [Aphelenchoides fujianensis]
MPAAANGSRNGRIDSVDFTIGGQPNGQPAAPKRTCTCRRKKLPHWTNELHGLAQLLTAETWVDRAFWGLVIATCFCCALWFSQILFADYIREQTYTLNEFEHTTKLAFPNIVLCPKNPDHLQFDEIRKGGANVKEKLSRSVLDLSKYITNVSDAEFFDYITYVVAGSGVHGYEKHLHAWKENYTTYVGEQVKTWRGNRTWEQFFTFIFDENGYKCQEMLQYCFYGYYQAIPCCDIFHPIYVLHRGRCMRLGEFYQSDGGDLGKLQTNMNQLHTNFFGRNTTQPQMIVYMIAGRLEEGDVSLSPRLYMAASSWNEIRFQKKYVHMLKERGQECSSAIDNLGVPRCQTNAHLRQLYIEPFNCTIYPFHGSRTYFLRTCDPSVIIQNYDWIFKTHVKTTHCRPACERFDVREQKFTSPARDPTNRYTTPFQIQFQFNELYIEKYTELQYTSVPGFVSQLGGQIMLFLGISLQTVIHVLFVIGKWLKRKFRCLRNRQQVYS